MDSWNGILCAVKYDFDSSGSNGNNGTRGGNGGDDGDADGFGMAMMMGRGGGLSSLDDDSNNGDEEADDSARSGSEDFSQYMIKHTISDDAVRVHLSDGRRLWSHSIERRRLLRLNRKYNPGIEIEEQNLLEILSRSVLCGPVAATIGETGDSSRLGTGIPSAEARRGKTRFSLTLQGADSDTAVLSIATTTDDGIQLNWKCELEAEPQEDFYEQVTAPLLASLAVTRQYAKALEDEIRKLSGKVDMRFASAQRKQADKIPDEWVMTLPFSEVFTPSVSDIYKNVYLKLHPDHEPSAKQLGLATGDRGDDEPGEDIGSTRASALDGEDVSPLKMHSARAPNAPSFAAQTQDPFLSQTSRHLDLSTSTQAGNDDGGDADRGPATTAELSSTSSPLAFAPTIVRKRGINFSSGKRAHDNDNDGDGPASSTNVPTTATTTVTTTTTAADQPPPTKKKKKKKKKDLL